MADDLRVLIVDDQPAIVQALRVLLDIHDIPNVVATTPGEALGIASSELLGAVIQDMNFTHREVSGEEGIDLFGTRRRAQPDLPILLMTAWASLETAVDLAKAFDPVPAAVFHVAGQASIQLAFADPGADLESTSRELSRSSNSAWHEVSRGLSLRVR